MVKKQKCGKIVAPRDVKYIYNDHLIISYWAITQILVYQLQNLAIEN